MTVVLALVAAYLVGSIDLAGIVARMSGVDPRDHEPEELLRVLARLPAAIIMVGNAMKGVLAAAMGVVASGIADPQVHWAFAAGLAAVAGHGYPLFHRFRNGGSGLAPAAGLLLFTVPLAGMITILVWVFVAVWSKPAVGSLTSSALTIPLVAWQGVRGLALLWLLLAILLVLWRQKTAIGAMFRGSEERVST